MTGAYFRQFTPSSPVTRLKYIVRFLGGGSRESGRSLSKLQWVRRVLCPVGPCGLMPEDHRSRTIWGFNTRYEGITFFDENERLFFCNSCN